MPKVETCWGIDIGNASLKALRLRPGESPQLVVAEAFDYIEYPMLLTQPSADPALFGSSFLVMRSAGTKLPFLSRARRDWRVS